MTLLKCLVFVSAKVKLLMHTVFAAAKVVTNAYSQCLKQQKSSYKCIQSVFAAAKVKLLMHTVSV